MRRCSDWWMPLARLKWVVTTRAAADDEACDGGRPSTSRAAVEGASAATLEEASDVTALDAMRLPSLILLGRGRAPDIRAGSELRRTA